MGAACTSSYQATQPDWHLLGIATRTSRQIKPKTQLRSAKAWVRLARGDTSNILTVKSTLVLTGPPSRTYDDSASDAGRLKRRSNRGKVSGSRQSDPGWRPIDGRGSSAHWGWPELVLRHRAQHSFGHSRR